MRHVIDGVRYNVESYGNGFPVILLHGFTGDSSNWTPFLERWGKQSKLFMVDIIGHGKSDSPEELERYHMLSVVDDLFLLMEKLKIQKADFVGYSMGGRLALSFAAKYPTKVRKLVLESASPGLESDIERKQRIEQDKKLAAFIEEKGVADFVDYWENIPLFASQKRLPNESQKQIREQRLRNSTQGLVNSLKGMGIGSQPSWWQELSELKVDMLLITGALDQKFCQIAKKMQNIVNHAEWITVSDCGHTIHVENAEKFGTIVEGYLSNTGS
ncbi:putative 2-succinyl-6-hydroxy-2,4-cyclohexadiene-1-carboxylate synthase [Robertmurraya siralis]|uniref:Putative 2-succinyl-6-hydroxy-2,4-cyclohexadiene-1-carboxylate synthase n=1 Tax=Robertmurraya siralis TaxID=77777 RepID=A0A919WDX3_9BACI|nr:2-succinyl-6-hydroxy-2,4-cyclohexadiene-1-carboxylate synthase [Robertmurraya siralis]PAE19474.1 2-succinyl-6-hydroxy-2,4-cyclohexadiene-1-carboxylate synthase [Bacillus sp. 7504-2]GIN60023.1 putative 2-succinyl-6-hydroxy-2,4-cyclohexadiene-1-carboxylate synthase [Robertmurraya siralis]